MIPGCLPACSRTAIRSIWSSGRPNGPRRRLFHIQSIRDVELFGINASNYGAFVLERPVWESRSGFSAADLQRSTLVVTCAVALACRVFSFPHLPLSPPPPEPRVSRGKPGGAVFPPNPALLATTMMTITTMTTTTPTPRRIRRRPRPPTDQTATATATATDDGTSVTNTATDDTDDATDTNTATATATATATDGDTATATATATDDGTSVTNTATDDTDTNTATPTDTADDDSD